MDLEKVVADLFVDTIFEPGHCRGDWVTREDVMLALGPAIVSAIERAIAAEREKVVSYLEDQSDMYQQSATASASTIRTLREEESLVCARLADEVRHGEHIKPAEQEPFVDPRPDITREAANERNEKLARKYAWRREATEQFRRDREGRKRATQGTHLGLRLDPDERAMVDAAAEAAGKKTATWAREVLVRAAKRRLGTKGVTL